MCTWRLTITSRKLWSNLFYMSRAFFLWKMFLESPFRQTMCRQAVGSLGIERHGCMGYAPTAVKSARNSTRVCSGASHCCVCSPLDQVDTWAHGKAKRPATLLSWSRPAHRMHAFPKGPSRSSAPVGGRIDRAGYESEQVGSRNVHLGCSQAQRQEVAKRIPGCMCYGPNR